MIDDLEYAGGSYSWATAIDSAYCATQVKTCGDTKESCDIEKLKVQGVCPDGWRIPNNSDWQALVNSLGTGSAATARNMWWYQGGLWWSASELNNEGIEAWVVDPINTVFDWCAPCLANGKAARNKVRCIKDEE